MLNWLIENWYSVVFVILAVCIVIYGLLAGKTKEWLKYAVTLAEKELGSGTGQLKLRYVYDKFVQQFPVFATIVPFNIFSKWVDLSLEWMREQLDNNTSIKSFVEDV